MKKKRKKNKKSKLIFLFLLFALVSLGVLMIISFKAWNFVEKQEIEKIEIIDDCSLFMGSLLHQIRDLADCENSCRSECYTLSKKFIDVEFQNIEESCNVCNCYCK